MDAERLFLRDDDQGLAVQVTELGTPGTASRLTMRTPADLAAILLLGTSRLEQYLHVRFQFCFAFHVWCQRHDATVVDLFLQESQQFRGTRIL